MLNESLNSGYYVNPYACDYSDDVKCSETLEIYDGEIPDFSDEDDFDDDDPYTGYDSRRYISTSVLSQRASAANSRADRLSVDSDDFDEPSEVDESLFDDDYLPY